DLCTRLGGNQRCDPDAYAAPTQQPLGDGGGTQQLRSPRIILGKHRGRPLAKRRNDQRAADGNPQDRQQQLRKRETRQRHASSIRPGGNQVEQTASHTRLLRTFQGRTTALVVNPTGGVAALSRRLIAGNPLGSKDAAKGEAGNRRLPASPW